MIFTEPLFFVFLFAVFAAHWTARQQSTRLMILLAASAVFYGWWDMRFLALIGLVILVSWWAAREVAARPAGDLIRRRWLIGAIAHHLVVLGLFKYAGFFSESAATVLLAMGLTPSWPLLNLILPVGISFFIFQAISYLVDTARGDLPVEHRVSRVALYIAFFPQLVAGPIVRAAHFFPQMDRKRSLLKARLASGVRAFAIGFVYKAGIADNLAPLVDPVYGGDLAVWSNSALIGATVAFGGQIYFDFAGYSLMAIGVARLLGYHIPRNFNFPYAATSIAAFWQRWHISLSHWLRDYLYIPLGGNRGSDFATYRNLMATMLLGGLWHGAAWTFVAWGALHGGALAVHRHLFPKGTAGPGLWLSLSVTQLFVLLAWVPFRADSFADTLTIWQAFVWMPSGGTQTLSAAVWCVPLLIGLDVAIGRYGRRIQRALPLLQRPELYWTGMGVAAGCLMALYPLQAAPFVYFQF